MGVVHHGIAAGAGVLQGRANGFLCLGSQSIGSQHGSDLLGSTPKMARDGPSRTCRNGTIHLSLGWGRCQNSHGDRGRALMAA
jgi:hypothetical protein